MKISKKTFLLFIILTLLFTSVVSAQNKKSSNNEVQISKEEMEREQFLLKEVQELDQKMAKAPLDQRLKARDALLKKYNVKLVSREYSADNEVNTQESDKNKLTLVVNGYQDEENPRAYYVYGDYDWSSTTAYPMDSELGAPDDAVALRMRETESEKLSIQGRALWNYDVYGNSQSTRVSKRYEDKIGVIWDLDDYSSVTNNWTDHGTAYMYIVAKIGSGSFQVKTYMDYEHNKGPESSTTVGFAYGVLNVTYQYNPFVKWQKNAASLELYFN